MVLSAALFLDGKHEIKKLTLNWYPKVGCSVSDSTIELGFKPLHLGEYVNAVAYVLVCIKIA